MKTRILLVSMLVIGIVGVVLVSWRDLEDEEIISSIVRDETCLRIDRIVNGEGHCLWIKPVYPFMLLGESRLYLVFDDGTWFKVLYKEKCKGFVHGQFKIYGKHIEKPEDVTEEKLAGLLIKPRIICRGKVDFQNDICNQSKEGSHK